MNTPLAIHLLEEAIKEEQIHYGRMHSKPLDENELIRNVEISQRKSTKENIDKMVSELAYLKELNKQ